MHFLHSTAGGKNAMTIREIAETLDATWLCCEEEDGRVLRTAFASDMMSDVLAFVKDQSVLLTGLVNPQVVRTADMMADGCTKVGCTAMGDAILERI